MVLGWLDTRAVVDFANTASAEIVRLMPVGTHERNRKKAARSMQKLERLVRDAKAFSKNNKLNFYKRAKLVNTLQWHLREAGYPEDFVGDVVRLIVVNL